MEYYFIVDGGIFLIVCIVVFFLIINGAKSTADWLMNHIWLIVSIGFAKCLLNFLNKEYRIKERWGIFFIDIFKTGAMYTHILIFLNILIKEWGSGGILEMLGFAFSLVMGGIIFMGIPGIFYLAHDATMFSDEDDFRTKILGGIISTIVTSITLGAMLLFNS